MDDGFGSVTRRALARRAIVSEDCVQFSARSGGGSIDGPKTVVRVYYDGVRPGGGQAREPSGANPECHDTTGAGAARVLERVRRWLGAVVALHERSPAEREQFRRLPVSVRGFLIISCLVDLYALTRVAPRDLPAVGALIAMFALTMLVPPVPSPLGYVRTVPRLAFTATIALLWSPLHTFVGVAFGTLLGVFAFRLYEPWRAAVNMFSWAYPAVVASMAGHMAFSVIPDPLLGLTAASVVIVVVYWALNNAAFALVLRRGDPFFQHWWNLVKESPLGQILSAPLSIFLGAIALGLGSRPGIVLLLTGLAALTIPSARAQLTLHFASQRTSTDIVHALMLALERTIPGAGQHAERVSTLVVETGRLLHVPARIVEVWRQAGLLHDVGLIETRSRTGAPEAHAAVGARILADHPDPLVADIVRDHHTPWSHVSSNGQPVITLGAHVLAAAEAYDELRHGTANAPGLMTHAAAAEALRARAGAQLDPEITAVVLEAAARLDRRPAA